MIAVSTKVHSFGLRVLLLAWLTLYAPQLYADDRSAKIAQEIDKLRFGGSKSRFAADKLGNIGAPAVPALIEALSSKESSFTREYAALALAKIGKDAEPALPALAIALRDEYGGNISMNASKAMAAIGKPAVPLLTEALADKVYWVRWRAAWALVRIGPDSAAAVPALTKALADKHKAVRQLSAKALGRIGKAAATAKTGLTKALNDPEESVRKEAAKALTSIE